MTVAQAALLGLIQGIAEWLPVSSSAHLDLARRLLGIRGESVLLFPIFLHLATVGVGVWTFRADVRRLLTSRRRDLLWLTIATIPAAAVGFCFKKGIEAEFASVTTIGAFLMLTGLLLLASHWFSVGARPVGFDYEREHGSYPRGLPAPIGAREAVPDRALPPHLALRCNVDPDVEEAELPVFSGEGAAPSVPLAPIPDEGAVGIPEVGPRGWPSPAQAMAIGLAQTAALLPGISRSGATLSAALFAGLPPERAVPYVFLLGLPITAGAVLVKLKDCAQSPVPVEPITWVVGFGTAVGASLLVIGPALRFLARGGAGKVGIYCLGAGAAVVLAAAGGRL